MAGGAAGGVEGAGAQRIGCPAFQSLAPGPRGHRKDKLSVVALKIHRFNLWFHYEMPGRELVINYVPIARDAGGEEHEVADYGAQLRLANDLVSEHLQNKLDRLAQYAESQLATPEIEIDGAAARGTPRLWYLQVIFGTSGNRLTINRMHVTYYVTATDRNAAGRDLGLVRQ